MPTQHPRTTVDFGRNRANVVLTGLPRSGTTLACRLLNTLPNTVALHEPFSPRFFVEMEEEAMREKRERFLRRTRRTIRKNGVAPSRTIDGEIPENAYLAARSGELRPAAGWPGKGVGEITVDKDLEGRFLLVMKQPAIFTALLPVLAGRFPCYAIVRNPLSVLASWSSVDHPAQDGHAVGAELYDDELRRELASTEDRVCRQLRLLSWWYGRLHETLAGDRIVRYEDIVSSGGAALSVLTPRAKRLGEPLSSQNRNPLYGRERMRVLGARLLETDGPYWRFYSRKSVEDLLEAL